MKDVELALQQEETQRTADGSAVVQEVTISVFVKLGIDIQHMQYVVPPSLASTRIVCS